MKYLLVICLCFALFSCQEKRIVGSSYQLKATDKYYHLTLDDNTYVPLKNISYFQERGNEYIVFINRQSTELLIYNLLTGKLVKKLSYQKEGQGGIVKEIGDFNVQSLNEIYLSSPYTRILYKSDGEGIITNTYDYSKSITGEPLTPILSSMGRLELIEGKFYLTQNLNRIYGEDTFEKSSLSAILDTTTLQVKHSIIKYSPMVSWKDMGTSGFGYQYRRTFDGTHFIYSFLYKDMLYKVSRDHKQIESVQVKSQYIPEIKVNDLSTDDFKKILKLTCEEPTYEDRVYDKYRKVYYRFACPPTSVDEEEDLLEVIRFGKKQFSIIILDQNLKKIGETLFPEYTYVPTAYFIREDGLYLSCSHFKNPDYSDDVLCFQKIELIGKE